MADDNKPGECFAGEKLADENTPGECFARGITADENEPGECFARGMADENMPGEFLAAQIPTTAGYAAPEANSFLMFSDAKER